MCRGPLLFCATNTDLAGAGTLFLVHTSHQTSWLENAPQLRLAATLALASAFGARKRSTATSPSHECVAFVLPMIVVLDSRRPSSLAVDVNLRLEVFLGMTLVPCRNVCKYLQQQQYLAARSMGLCPGYATADNGKSVTTKSGAFG